ncbi:hypothetical protein RclHR1_19820004 [Rhizophagus clarus]|uniref:Uncharacterized protein n=1 Tax=Rhizophagus clarus TaxID=94130 RepID=A0A2Z6RII8_9GLOM|nr:hypothetical protein RclHR1_19820004 [Rhizophagus clarus]GES99951.1 hypothetical protein RCL_jg2898.t1 [Rhizophagus clarus]
MNRIRKSAKKLNKHTPLAVSINENTNTNTVDQVSLKSTQQLHQADNKPTSIKGIIKIPAVFTPPSQFQQRDTILIDLDLINLKAQPTEDRYVLQDSQVYINLYLQNLRSLSEDTFITNSLFNDVNDQILDHYRKDSFNDHTIEVFAALDNLKIISDEKPLSHTITYTESDPLSHQNILSC